MKAQTTEKRPRILVIQHSPDAPGAFFSKSLTEAGAELLTLSPFANDPLPEQDIFDAMVVLGGPQNAEDDETGRHFNELMEMMRRYESQNKPVAAICLGCQLLSRAYGGTPTKLGWLEFGFIKHRLTEKGLEDPVVGNCQLPALMEFHEDSFALPKNADLLIIGEKCKPQCFRIGSRSYGFQFHLEVDLDVAGNWLRKFRDNEISAYRQYRKEYSNEELEEMETKLAGLLPESMQFCQQVARRWLALIDS